jgi:hypothetical protein
MRLLRVLYRIIGEFPGYFWFAESPADFWTKWNPGLHSYFVWMYKRLLRWFYRKTGRGFGHFVHGVYIITVFVVMGVLHDLFVYAIVDEFPLFSTTYFCLNGMLVLLETKFGLRLSWGRHRYVRRVTTLIVVASTLVLAGYVAS